jgi:hypothetical protein
MTHERKFPPQNEVICLQRMPRLRKQRCSLWEANIMDSWAQICARVAKELLSYTESHNWISLRAADEISEMRTARDTFQSYATCRTGVPSRKPINKSKARVRHSQPGVLSLTQSPSLLSAALVPIVSCFGRRKQRLAQICKSEFLDVAMFMIITRNLIIPFFSATPQVLNTYDFVRACVLLTSSRFCFISLWSTTASQRFEIYTGESIVLTRKRNKTRHASLNNIL